MIDLAAPSFFFIAPSFGKRQNAQSEDEVLEIPERGSNYNDNSPHRGSVVREYVGLLDDLEDDAKETETQNTAPSTLPEVKKTATLPAGEGDAGGLSGDLGQYADTSWSLTSPRAGGVNPKQIMGLGDSTVSKGRPGSTLLLHEYRNASRIATRKNDHEGRMVPRQGFGGIGASGLAATSFDIINVGHPTTILRQTIRHVYQPRVDVASLSKVGFSFEQWRNIGNASSLICEKIELSAASSGGRAGTLENTIVKLQE